MLGNNKISCLLFCATFSSLLISCSFDSDFSKESSFRNNQSANDSQVTEFLKKNFVRISGATVECKGSKGVFVADRTVTLDAFYISKYEVTQELYKQVTDGKKLICNGVEYPINSTPSFYSPTNSYYSDVWYVDNYGIQNKRPVEQVTWYDAVYFCNLLSEQEGLTKAYNIKINKLTSTNNIWLADVSLVPGANGYRLPTEAEWEYAARGANCNAKEWNYTFSGIDSINSVSIESNSNIDKVGWYCLNNRTGITNEAEDVDDYKTFGTHQVGLKAPNSLGIYDMTGNVAEWCYDIFNSTLELGNLTNPLGANLENPSDVYGFEDADYTALNYGERRTIKGGSWYNYYIACKVSDRGQRQRAGDARGDDLGIRVVRSAK